MTRAGDLHSSGHRDNSTLGHSFPLEFLLYVTLPPKVGILQSELFTYVGNNSTNVDGEEATLCATL